MRGGQLRPILVTTAPFTVQASGSPTEGYAPNNSNTAQSGPVQAVVSGGAGPYSYAWTLKEHDGGSLPVATSPSFASTSFRKSGLLPEDFRTATFDCLVTDATGATGICTAHITFYGPPFTGGGGVPL